MCKLTRIHQQRWSAPLTQLQPLWKASQQCARQVTTYCSLISTAPCTQTCQTLAEAMGPASFKDNKELVRREQAKTDFHHLLPRRGAHRLLIVEKRRLITVMSIKVSAAASLLRPLRRRKSRRWSFWMQWSTKVRDTIETWTPGSDAVYPLKRWLIL